MYILAHACVGCSMAVDGVRWRSGEKVHAEGPRQWRVNASRRGLRDPRSPGGVMGSPHGALKSKSTWVSQRRRRWQVRVGCPLWWERKRYWGTAALAERSDTRPHEDLTGLASKSGVSHVVRRCTSRFSDLGLKITGGWFHGLGLKIRGKRVSQFRPQNRGVWASPVRRATLGWRTRGTIAKVASRQNEVAKVPGFSYALKKSWTVLPLRGIWAVCFM